MILAFGDLGTWERDLLHQVTCTWHAPWLADFLGFMQHRWVAVVLVVLGCVVLGRRDPRRGVRTFLAAALALGLGLGVATPLWHVVGRDRPGQVYETVLRTPEELAGCAGRPDALALRSPGSRSPAFPSHHAVSAGALATAFWFASRPIGVLAWLLGLVVGWARLYFGKHWPTDLLGGYVLGALAAWVAWRALPWLLPRLGLGRLMAAPGPAGAGGTHPPPAPVPEPGSR